MANMITLTVGDNVTTEMFKSYIDNKAYSQIDLRDILPVRPIEMTKNQYLFITSDYEKESVVDAVANLTADNIIKEEFHSNFWSPLSEKQVVQAWLHPETIKVVDNDI